MDICEECKTKPVEYNRNPVTGRPTPARGWCKDCYERLSQRSQRDAKPIRREYK